MKLRLSVFVGCVLCVVLVGVYGLLSRTSDSRDGWRPSDMYSAVGGSSYSGSSYSGSSYSSDGSGALAVSMRGGNSMLRRRAVSLYAPVYTAPNTLANSQYPIGGTPSNSVASPLYTTSSATMKSFGGGGTMGVSMSGGSVRSSASQPTMSATSMSLSAMSAPVLAYDPSASQSLFSEIAMAIPAYQGIGNTTPNAPRAIRGRQNAGPATNTSGWLNWLALNGYGTQGADGVWGLDVYELLQAYEAYCEAWNPTMGGDGPPTWDEWLSWFMESEDSPYGWTDDGGDSYSYYKFVPIGDVMPFLLLALLYTVILIIRRRKLSMGCRSLE